MLAHSNGFPTQDTSGTQGTQYTSQECIQCEAYTAAGGTKGKDRYITIENSSQVVPFFLVEEVATVDELVKKIQQRIPALAHPSLGMRISNVRTGGFPVKYFTDALPDDSVFLFVSLYLKKHPRIDFREN